MADSGWFRAFGQRPRTPSSLPQSPIPDNHEEEAEVRQPSRPRPTPISRASSYLGLNLVGGSNSRHDSRQIGPATLTPATPTTPATMTMEMSEAEKTNRLLEERDRVWHNPNLLQMVETLQVAMMTKCDPLQPIPVQYNSYVLNMLEGFGRLQDNISETERRVVELERTRQKDLEAFRSISEEVSGSRGTVKV